MPISAMHSADVHSNFTRLMNKREKRTLLILSGLITTLVVYVTVRLWTSDEAFSVVPGWHTTIYPTGLTLTILTIGILVTSIIVYLVFRDNQTVDCPLEKNEIMIVPCCCGQRISPIQNLLSRND
jgi:hypothetical protein